MLLFIADLHLRIENSLTTDSFLCFLRREAKSADALYILGDLFDAWIGDDDPSPLHREIAAAINSLVSSGISCYFIHGNRDFLLGKRYARESGMILLSEEQILDFYGYRILIMHGDTLCTNDTRYQIFRTIIHTFWIQKLFLSLPLCIRTHIASRMRKVSKVANNSKSLSVMDVNTKTVIQLMEKHNTQFLIHGHTHCLNIHEMTSKGVLTYRMVLGSWHKRGSMAKVTPDRIELTVFPF